MPAITGSSLGYAGEVNELTGMNYWNRIGASKYGVAGANDLKVSKTTGDRMLLVSSGIAWGHNIEDTLQTSVSVQLNSVSSGSRWDLVVVRRDVTAGTTIEVVQGTSSKTLPSLTSTAASHPDQPLALCRVTADSTTVEEIVDLRAWASNGGVEIADRLALDYLGTPGAAVKLGRDTWHFELKSNGVWGWGRAGRFTQAGNVSVATNAAGDAYFNFPEPFPNRLDSLVVTDSSSPVLWGPLILKWAPEYSSASRGCARVYGLDGRALSNRTGLWLSYSATGS